MMFRFLRYPNQTIYYFHQYHPCIKKISIHNSAETKYFINVQGLAGKTKKMKGHQMSGHEFPPPLHQPFYPSLISLFSLPSPPFDELYHIPLISLVLCQYIEDTQPFSLNFISEMRIIEMVPYGFWEKNIGMQ